MLFLALANGVKHSRHAFNYFHNIYDRKAHFRAKIILHLSGWSIKSSPEVLCMAGSNCTVDLSTLQSQNLPTHTYQSYTGLRIDGTNIWCYSRKTVPYTSMCCCLTVSNHTCWSIISCVSFWQYKNRIPTQPTRKLNAWVYPTHVYLCEIIVVILLPSENVLLFGSGVHVGAEKMKPRYSN